jgi:hypothetical protein
MDERRPYHGYRAHPWHGLEVGKNPPRYVNAFIEITPFDLVKYELDKDTGFMVWFRSAHLLRSRSGQADGWRPVWRP